MGEFCSLKLEDNLGLKANYHTHTTRCKHATGEEKEYIEAAIKEGFKVLGFSDHTPILFPDAYMKKIRMDASEFDGYVDKIEKLKKEYAKDIKIYLGVEVEYLKDYFDEYIEWMKEYPLDYMLLSQHVYPTENGCVHVARGREDEASIKWYVDSLIEGLDTGYFLYAAHPDIIKFTGSSKIYDRYMKYLIKELKNRNVPIELNLGGYAESSHYPNFHFVEMAIENGNEFIVGVDAHSPEEFNKEIFNSCVEKVSKMGGRIINL